MNRLWFSSVLLACGIVGTAVDAKACACQGASGLARVMTTPNERWAVSIGETARLVHGFWDQQGDYSPVLETGFQGQLDFSITAAFRFSPRFELSGNAAYGKTTVTAPGFFSERTGLGDTTLTLRWEALNDPPPHQRSWLRPGLAVLGSLRSPTGLIETSSEESSSSPLVGSGSGASSQTLGAWELALALEARHRLSDYWQLLVMGEGALRAEDEALGIERQLGPRLLGQVALSYDVTPSAIVALLSDLAWEGDISLAGQDRSGTGQRVWNVGGFAGMALMDSGLHSSVTLRYAPPISGVSVNAIGATVFGVSVGYSR